MGSGCQHYENKVYMHRRTTVPLTTNKGRIITYKNVSIFLGMKISCEDTLVKIISERNIYRRRAFKTLNSILRDKSISKENKKRIYNSIVKSIITYCSKMWSLIKGKIKKKNDIDHRNEFLEKNS